LTAFVTWLKTSAAEALPLAVALSGILLSGCIRLPGGSSQTEQPPAPPPPQEPRAPEPLEATGLTPLPTADQLLASLPTGRSDPFAPEPGAATAINADSNPAAAPAARSAGEGGAIAQPAGAAAQRSGSAPGQRPAPLPPLQLPAGFRFSGVMRAGSRPQALVQLGGDSGTVCVGVRGFCAGSGLAALLPQGWTVAAIDVERGRLTLRQGRRSVTAEL
jgi:hypothetical protein